MPCMDKRSAILQQFGGGAAPQERRKSAALLSIASARSSTTFLLFPFMKPSSEQFPSIFLRSVLLRGPLKQASP